MPDQTTNPTPSTPVYSHARPIVDAFRDLLRGLFPLRTRPADPGCDYASEIEERYSKPRRCC